MTESEFLEQVEHVLEAIESALERAADDTDVDVECSRSGNVLEIEFVDNGSKIIVNSQAAMQEMWIAARSGGFHYRYKDGLWKNTRDGSEMLAALAAMIEQQGGTPIPISLGN